MPTKKPWTPQQLQAIDAKDKTILVSAAAGSGKTATLTERIIKRITVDNADISNMLIVTFTRSAAADLKLKIFNAITAELAQTTDAAVASKLSAQLANINNASICTIDSFYYELIKSHFTECGISPTFRIIDDGEYKLIAKSTISEVIDEFYGSGGFACYGIDSRGAVPRAGGGYFIAVAKGNDLRFATLVGHGYLADFLTENAVDGVALWHARHTDKVNFVGRRIDLYLKLPFGDDDYGLFGKVNGKRAKRADLFGEDGALCHMSHVSALKVEARYRLGGFLHHLGKYLALLGGGDDVGEVDGGVICLVG